MVYRGFDPRTGTRDMQPIAAMSSAAALLLALLAGGPHSEVLQVSIVSGSATAFCLYLFMRGGTLIQPSSIYFLSLAVFFGLGGLVAAWMHPNSMSPSLVRAVVFGQAANLLTWAVWYRYRKSESPRKGGERTTGLVALHYYFFAAGAACLIVGTLVQASSVDAGPTPFVLAYLGLVLITAALLEMRKRAATMVVSVAALGLLLMFLDRFFSVEGRLRWATLALTILMLINFRLPRLWHKRLIVACLIPALVAGGMLRSEAPNANRVLFAGEGLGSLWTPVTTFGEMVRADEGASSRRLERQYGMTFASAAVAWVPRSLWEDKPVGFGAILTQHLAPGLVAQRHSMAALAHGEWYANFGWAGLVLMGGLTGMLIATLDRWQLAIRRLEKGARRSFGSIAIALGAAGLADYIWVGSHTFMARNGMAIAILGVIYVISNGLVKPGTTRGVEVVPRGDF